MRNGFPGVVTCALLITTSVNAQAPQPDSDPAASACSVPTDLYPEPSLPRMWFGSDYMLWWVRKAPVPAP